MPKHPVLEGATSLHATITTAQLNKLREVSARSGKSHSELVRTALDALFSQQQQQK